jgi:hypothetical protein
MPALLTIQQQKNNFIVAKPQICLNYHSHSWEDHRLGLDARTAADHETNMRHKQAHEAIEVTHTAGKTTGLGLMPALLTKHYVVTAIGHV